MIQSSNLLVALALSASFGLLPVPAQARTAPSAAPQPLPSLTGARPSRGQQAQAGRYKATFSKKLGYFVVKNGKLVCASQGGPKCTGNKAQYAELDKRTPVQTASLNPAQTALFPFVAAALGAAEVVACGSAGFYGAAVYGSEGLPLTLRAVWMAQAQGKAAGGVLAGSVAVGQMYSSWAASLAMTATMYATAALTAVVVVCAASAAGGAIYYRAMVAAAGDIQKSRTNDGTPMSFRCEPKPMRWL